MQEEQILPRNPTSPLESSSVDSPPELSDPTVWHWWFFLRNHSLDRQRDTHWSVFLPALDDAVTWAGEWELSKVLRPEGEPSDDRYPTLFAKIPRRQRDALTYSFQARSLLDSTYLRFVWTLPGSFRADSFSQLRNHDWKYSSGEKPFFGDATCLMAEVPENTGLDAAKNIIRRILANWHAKEIKEVKVIQFACGFYGITDEHEDVVWVILVWNNDQSRRQASRLANDITPRFMLAWMKSRYIRRKYDTTIAQEMNSIERQLESEIEQNNKTPSRLATLEDATLKIATPLEKLFEKIHYTKEYLETLSINRDNLEQLLKDPVFGDGSSTMDSILVAPIRQSINQLEIDLEYKAITEARANLKLETNRIRAEILANRWSRSITVLLGVFVIFGVVQAFDSELKALGKYLPIFQSQMETLNQAWPKLAVAVLGSIILWLCTWLYSRGR